MNFDDRAITTKLTTDELDFKAAREFWRNLPKTSPGRLPQETISKMIREGLTGVFPELLDIIALKKTQMQDRWPGRGRPSRRRSAIGTDELAKQLQQLLMNGYPKGLLAPDLAIDPKTLNKILSGKPVTERIRENVKNRLPDLIAQIDKRGKSG